MDMIPMKQAYLFIRSSLYRPSAYFACSCRPPNKIQHPPKLLINDCLVCLVCLVRCFNF